MAEVELIAMDFASAVRAAAGDRSLFATASNVDTVYPLVGMVAAANAELYRRTKARPPWVGYLARDPASGAIVGSCGFKDACRDGAVEIAYFTFPQAEGRGWGLRMAAALLEIAWRHEEVERAVAHTLPQENASTRILRRLDFHLVGPVKDRDDGTVWRWELARAAALKVS
jgi:RimJ/RimL family protein N-acetyltransferase